MLPFLQLDLVRDERVRGAFRECLTIREKQASAGVGRRIGRGPWFFLRLVRGELGRPNGPMLMVKTVWIRLAETGEIRFVTLVPDEE